MEDKINSLGEAVDILDDFLDDLDEECGLAAIRYGSEASQALEFLYEYYNDQWRKEHLAPTINPYEWNEITYKTDEYGSVVFDKNQPPFNTFVNVYCPDNKCIYTAYWSYSDRVWKEPYMMNDFNLRITHWRPHPSPPTEKEN